MARYWASKGAVVSTADDTRTLSLHVLSAAGFGKYYPFQGYEDKVQASIATNYKESLQTILDNCVLLLALGTNVIKKPWLLAKIRELNKAVISFKA